MEDLQNFSIEYGLLNENKSVYVITNLSKQRGWNIYVTNRNVLVLDHRHFTQSQPPVIRLFDKIVPKSITYVNTDPFALTFDIDKVWPHFDDKGCMKFNTQLDLSHLGL